VARGGAQTVTWLAIVAWPFFVPAGLAVAELGAAFPRQGGPYVWARLAFGRLVGSLVALAGPRRSRHGRGAAVTGMRYGRSGEPLARPPDRAPTRPG
jgi:hypothetical protein